MLTLAVAIVTLAVAGAAISEGLESGEGSGRSAAALSGQACGTAGAATIAGVDSAVAQAIYAGELHSTSVSADAGHVTGSAALLRALAANNRAATYAAVHALVYMPHWHIVRLRVLQHGHVIADVGGPDVIAPVSGTLRWKGRIVGSYVMSVQDDVGYVKLVSRFIGVPIDLYRDGAFLMGTLQPAPAAPTPGGSLSVGGALYQAHMLTAAAFPSGSLQVALLVPVPAGAGAQESCATLRLGAWGNVVRHIAARLRPLSAHYADLADVLRGVTGGLTVVKAGSKRLAGAVLPAGIPRSGNVRFAGRSWSVFSWEPAPPARIYFLAPSG